jgi:cytochrome c oxidase cbb3-type subunit III
MADKHVDELSGVETTGHVWDGIRELNNPLPRWWVWTFYACIVWAFAYTIFYPAWPLLTTNTKGVLHQTNRSDLAAELTVAKGAQKVFVDKIAAMPVDEIVKDKSLAEFANAAGAAAFKVNCTPCHGSGAQGGIGYPNLNDNDWLWGGSAEQIYTTVAHGIRDPQDPNTRVSEMPAFGEMLKPQEIQNVAAYVADLSKQPVTVGDPAAGKQLFADNCVACHGDKAQGNRDLGAPNLADAIWLKGSGEAAIIAQVTKPKHGVMPAWTARLGDTTVKELAVFVHSLGGGE